MNSESSPWAGGEVCWLQPLSVVLGVAREYRCLFKNYLRERERKEGGETERKGKRNIDLLLNLFMHLMVASYMCPDQRLNL